MRLLFVLISLFLAGCAKEATYLKCEATSEEDYPEVWIALNYGKMEFTEWRYKEYNLPDISDWVIDFGSFKKEEDSYNLYTTNYPDDEPSLRIYRKNLVMTQTYNSAILFCKIIDELEIQKLPKDEPPEPQKNKI